MGNRINYTLVGAFVLALSVFTIFIGFWLLTQGHSKIYNTYLVYARGGVDGLTVSTPIYFNGVRVGYVDDIQLSSVNPQLVKITLKIESGVPLTQSTRATLVPQGITGIVYVGLEAGSPPSKIPLKILPGQKYPIIVYREPLMAQIGQTLPDITKNIQKVTRSFTEVFNDRNNESLAKILTNTARITQDLADNSKKINESLVMLQGVLENTKDASVHLKDTLSSVNQATTQIADTMQKSQGVLNNMDSQLLPGLFQLLQQLQQMSSNFQDFSNQIAQNPAVIVRGKKYDTERDGHW